MKRSQFPYNILKFIGITPKTSGLKKWFYGGLAVGAFIAAIVFFALLTTTPIGVATVGIVFTTFGLGAAIGGLIGNFLEMRKNKTQVATGGSATLAAMSSTGIIAAATGLALLLVGSFISLNPGIGLAIWIGVSLGGAIASGLSFRAMANRFSKEAGQEVAAAPERGTPGVAGLAADAAPAATAEKPAPASWLDDRSSGRQPLLPADGAASVDDGVPGGTASPVTPRV